MTEDSGIGVGAGYGITCAGNWILDLVHDIPHWPEKSDLVQISAQNAGLGGGAANVSGDLTALGVPYPVTPIGVIGDDVNGQTVVTLCQQAGIPAEGLRVLAGQTTACTHVMNVPGDSRTFFYNSGANDHFTAEHVDLDQLDRQAPRIFYLGYLNLLPGLDAIGLDGRTLAAEVLSQVRALGILTCVDLVSSQSPTYAEIVAGTLPEVDVLFLNEAEASRATGVEITGPQDATGMEAAAQRLAAGGVRRAIVLHSPDLTLWYEGGIAQVFAVPKLDPARIISPVGAGDAFAAGVLHGLHEDWSVAACVALGHAVAAACLQGATATEGIPKLADLQLSLPGVS